MKEDIIRMAREAGIYTDNMLSSAIIGDSQLERFAALVAKHTLANIDPSSFMSWQEGYAAGAAAEREACAKVCDAEVDEMTEGEWSGCAMYLANNIRARGQT